MSNNQEAQIIALEAEVESWVYTANENNDGWQDCVKELETVRRDYEAKVEDLTNDLIKATDKIDRLKDQIYGLGQVPVR